MTEILKGFFKLQEELGELQQALGKAAVFPYGDHPDGLGPMLERVEDEIADVVAAAWYFVSINGLNNDKIEKRLDKKLEKFIQMRLLGVNHNGAN